MPGTSATRTPRTPRTPRAPRAPRTTRAPLRFVTQVFILQVAVVLATVAISAGVFVWVDTGQLVREAEATALAIARSVAEDPDVRSDVAEWSADPGTPTAAELANGPLETVAENVRVRTGALFVVITDDQGIRLAHPNPDELGETVSTSPDVALAGREDVSWERGTLGDSARAKVPVLAPGAAPGSTDDVVGEISVGFAASTVFDTLGDEIAPVVIGALAALGVGVAASILIGRRLRRLTLGLQPEELRALVQDQEAVLSGVGEGVIGLGPDDRITVCNDQAARLLGVTDAVGHTLDDLHLPADFRALVRGNGTEQQLLLNGRVVFIDVRTVSRDGAHLGRVVIVRDRTDVEALSRKLDAVNAMTTALRVQRHEFANRLHAISGLIATGEHDQAERYLADVLNHGPLKYPVEHADRLTEPYLQAFLGAKGVEASEKGVLLTIGAETLVTGRVVAAEDVTTVLGNLIDNAVAAAVAGRTTPAWVEVEVLDDGADLYLSVMDSGNGLDAGRDEVGDESAGFGGADHEAAGPPASANSDPDPDAVHGLGFGLPLSRDIARRSGGDLWLASRGVPGEHGAVFCVRLPGAVEPARPDNSSEGTP